jgi:hypothetical protein
MAIRQMTFFFNLTFAQIYDFPKIAPYQNDVTLNFPCVTVCLQVGLDCILPTDLI